MPELIGTLHQRHILAALKIGLADDAGFAVAGALRVAKFELLECENALAAFGQMCHRGRAHAARADDDGVVVGRHAYAPRRTSADDFDFDAEFKFGPDLVGCHNRHVQFLGDGETGAIAER